MTTMAPVRRPATRWMVLGAAALSGAAMLPTAQPWSRAPAALPAIPVAAGEDLSVLTYNVMGLPWPIGMGREAALERIADRLRALRADGRQPRIVLLQEAFTDAAKRIGQDSGYRFAASGPARGDVAEPGEATQAGFEAAGSALKGEGVGKLLDSGLQVLSDHPILAVRRAAFPTCAGYDCLANKGMVLVLVALPDGARVAIVNVHLNARKASGVDVARAFAAYRAQVAALDRFVREAAPAGVPVIVAGDLNVGKSPERRALVEATVGRWPGAGSKGVLHDCVARTRACGTGFPAEASTASTRNKDWQIALGGASVAPVPVRVAVPFGREADGSMLSDHIGYTIHYRLAPRRYS